MKRFRHPTSAAPSADAVCRLKQAIANFTLIELLVNTTCKIYNQSTATALRKREGFGGEKAAICAA
ncbi:hypothetical protein, partial [Victivallis vadensis]|uniref:hypothetical protein n=1 Tax=Victivallis vadensis TaxID=172901 RepID=UPI0023F52CDC